MKGQCKGCVYTVVALLSAQIMFHHFLNHCILKSFNHSKEERLNRKKLLSLSAQDGHRDKERPVSNGAVGRRPTLICPDRLKDFGAEEYLDVDVKCLETKVTEAPEIQLMCPVKPIKKRVSVCTPVSNVPAEYLRFEDISMAALKIQSGVQKTPCTVSQPLTQLYCLYHPIILCHPLSV